ncbi:MAG TPA: glucose 1-dehydrogenase [Candidatus Eisenbacteria bacterium]|nr:glucose 1-dehydrogenase [Candidatus Eisenbacteria bacterium]
MPQGRLDGKVALVTGGARGIGLAACRKLAAEGAAVAMTDVLDAEGNAAADELSREGARVFYRHHDVSREDHWTAAVDAAVTAFGALHVLVNNAAIARNDDVEAETLEGFTRVAAVNTTGAWLGMKAVIPHLKRAGGGSIVNIASIYGTIGGSGHAIAYHASKGALRLMTKSAALRYATEGIRVNSVHPGFIETPMVAPLLEPVDGKQNPFLGFILGSTPMRRLGRPDEVANVIAFLAGDESSYMTGSEVYVDGGWTAA